MLTIMTIIINAVIVTIMLARLRTEVVRVESVISVRVSPISPGIREAGFICPFIAYSDSLSLRMLSISITQSQSATDSVNITPQTRLKTSMPRRRIVSRKPCLLPAMVDIVNIPITATSKIIVRLYCIFLYICTRILINSM